MDAKEHKAVFNFTLVQILWYRNIAVLHVTFTIPSSILSISYRVRLVFGGSYVRATVGSIQRQISWYLFIHRLVRNIKQ